MKFQAVDLTVYAIDQNVEIVCLPSPEHGTMVERCDRASKIYLSPKETRGLISTLRDALRQLREQGCNTI